MCGIAGIWGEANEDLIRRMTETVAHRGPDDCGIRVFARSGHAVSLGHRRLSIIDLSPAGHQPMANEDETVWIVFNGEIYNFPELRKHLLSAGHRFRSRTDTEVLIHGYEEWGIDFVKRLNGIFAFALWDSRNELLHLARDRYGVKPLYYWRKGLRVLAYTDKTSMAFGVEVRVPYIDNEVVDFLTAVPPHLKMRWTVRKYLLKQALKGLVPAHILNRKKAGFGAPIRTWIVSDLKEMINDLLCETNLKRRGFFNPDYVRRLITENASGRHDYNYLIYILLSFELWCRVYLDQQTP